MERECGCNDWIGNIDKLLMAVYLHLHGFEYDGVLIRHCPWCGALLSNVPNDELWGIEAGERRV